MSQLLFSYSYFLKNFLRAFKLYTCLIFSLFSHLPMPSPTSSLLLSLLGDRATQNKPNIQRPPVPKKRSRHEG